MKKHLKLKPRGCPWPKGVSGNQAGRPPGSRHKITLAVLEGVKRAEEEMSEPLMRFKRTNFERVNPEGPIPIRPEQLDIGEIRQEVVWRGKMCWSQRGWLFDQLTYLPLKL